MEKKTDICSSTVSSSSSVRMKLLSHVWQDPPPTPQHYRVHVSSLSPAGPDQQPTPSPWRWSLMNMDHGCVCVCLCVWGGGVDDHIYQTIINKCWWGPSGSVVRSRRWSRMWTFVQGWREFDPLVKGRPLVKPLVKRLLFGASAVILHPSSSWPGRMLHKEQHCPCRRCCRPPPEPLVTSEWSCLQLKWKFFICQRANSGLQATI